METTNHIAYDIDKSSQRMDDILSAGNGNFSDSDSIPQRSSLTYTNGYYVNVTALFIDIVGSSDMTDEQLQCVDVWDDGVTWAEGHLRRAELEHIIVCHAVHDICTHKPLQKEQLVLLPEQ